MFYNLRIYSILTASIDVGGAVLRGKVCIVTGANSGIGKATALGLAELGAAVVMLCRDRVRGEVARAEIRERSGNDAVDLMLADLSVQSSIRDFVERFERAYGGLHVLVNNAGVVAARRTLTADGLELTFAVNYLAPFLLTNLLLDELKASAPARVVNVAGSLHRWGKINFDDLQLEKNYGAARAGCQSKLALVLFTYELARRLEGTAVTANCLHPGAVRAGIARDLPWYLRAPAFVARPFFVSPGRGARTSVYLASSPAVEGVTGKYFSKMREVRSSAASYDEEAAARLWRVSEELTVLRGDAG
jgi:NAD(P)-dependent dehydrogenase (short-subunit alcohol dehydrogenase family)